MVSICRESLCASTPSKGLRILKARLMTAYGSDVSCSNFAAHLINASEPMGKPPHYMHKVPLSALLTAAKYGCVLLLQLLRTNLGMGCCIGTIVSDGRVFYAGQVLTKNNAWA